MTYPGQRVQVDVKVVPRRCIANPGLCLFQYTAIDEFSRPALPGRLPGTKYLFLRQLPEKACRSGMHAAAYGWSAFRRTTVLNSPTASPTASGTCPPCLRLPPHSSASSTSSSVPIRRVTTAKWSAATGRTRNAFIPATAFYSLDDFAKQLAIHNRRSNNFPMRPLGWRSPSEFIVQYV